MSNSLPHGVVRIHLDTTRRFSARLAARIIDSAAESIESNSEIEGDITTALVASGEGTWWVHLAILAGGVGTCVLAIQSLAEEIRQGKTPFSRAIPAALDEGDGRIVTLCADDMEIRIGIAEIIAYPPPVGEDRLEWAVGRNDQPELNRARDRNVLRVTEDGQVRKAEDSTEIAAQGSPNKRRKLPAIRFIDPAKEPSTSEGWAMTIPTDYPDVVAYHAEQMYDGSFHRTSEGDFIKTIDEQGGNLFNLRGYSAETRLPFTEGQRIVVSGKPDYKGGIYPRAIFLDREAS